MQLTLTITVDCCRVICFGHVHNLCLRVFQGFSPTEWPPQTPTSSTIIAVRKEPYQLLIIEHHRIVVREEIHRRIFVSVTILLLPPAGFLPLSFMLSIPPRDYRTLTLAQTAAVKVLTCKTIPAFIRAYTKHRRIVGACVRPFCRTHLWNHRLLWPENNACDDRDLVIAVAAG